MKPEGVRVVRPDGTEIPCELIHQGYNAKLDMDDWVVTGVVFRPGLDKIRVAVFPARTGLSFEFKDEEDDR